MAHGRGRSSSFLGVSCVLAVGLMLLLSMFSGPDTGIVETSMMVNDAFVSVTNISRLRPRGIRRHADEAESEQENLEADDAGDVPDPEWKKNKKGFFRSLLLDRFFKEGRESYDWHKAKTEYLVNVPEQEKNYILKKSLQVSSAGEVEDEDRVTIKKEGVFRFKLEKTSHLGFERLTEMVDGRFRFIPEGSRSQRIPSGNVSFASSMKQTLGESFRRITNALRIRRF